MLKSMLFGCLLITVCYAEDVSNRSKRSYYGGFDTYGSLGDGDFWYAGRIFGVIAGFFLLLLCCCIPCVCLAGIWFLGWFGIRRRNTQRKEAQQTYPPSGIAVYNTPPRARHVAVETTQPTQVSRGDQVIYQAEDRFYTSSVPMNTRY